MGSCFGTKPSEEQVSNGAGFGSPKQQFFKVFAYRFFNAWIFNNRKTSTAISDFDGAIVDISIC